MRQISRSPSYLIRNPYSYCFRMIIPMELQPYFGKKELRYSLKTGYLGVAKQKARYLAGQVQFLFRFLRNRPVNYITKNDAKKLAKLLELWPSSI